MIRQCQISKSPPGVKLQIGNLCALAAGVTFLPHDDRAYWPGATSNNPSAAMTA